MEKLLTSEEYAQLFVAIWSSDDLSVDDMEALNATLDMMRFGIYNV